MSGKSTKLIIGIILLLLAVYMYAFGGFKFVVSLILGIIGLGLVVLSFTGKQEMDISEIEEEEEEEIPSAKETPEDLSDVTPDFPEPETKSDIPDVVEEKKKE